jgi:lysozyme
VSSYQGAIDWSAVAGDEISFAFIEATEAGDWVDERFADPQLWVRSPHRAPKGAWRVWQFTDNSKVSGIEGGVDMNVA